MKAEDKQFAEKALQQLLIGSQLDGIKFGAGPGGTFLYFLHYTEKEPDKLWVNIEINKFAVLPAAIKHSCKALPMIEELTEEQAIKQVIGLRREEVTDVKLGDESPHLFIVFKSQKVLFINGYDEQYECWQAGDGEGYTGDEWLVVAVPGNGIATWAPDTFG